MQEKGRVQVFQDGLKSCSHENNSANKTLNRTSVSLKIITRDIVENVVYFIDTFRVQKEIKGMNA